jgi:hypothetical protein
MRKCADQELQCVSTLPIADGPISCPGARELPYLAQGQDWENHKSSSKWSHSRAIF